MGDSGVDLFRRIYDGFRAPLSSVDCGRMCAPHNNGQPVCCSTAHAVPIVDVDEWRLLKARTRLWHIYRPSDAVGKAIKADLHRDCRAIECKGPAHCERDNRSLSCRTFPFFPYITREDEIPGLAYYWTFEDRCWVMSNLGTVERPFVEEFLAAYEAVFAHDRKEYESLKDHSAQMRRVFTRWRRIIPLIGRYGGYLAVEPGTHAIRPAQLEEFARHGPYAEKPAAAE